MRAFVVLYLLIFISCERDDICSEDSSRTPNAILRFYGLEERPDGLFFPKIVPKLRIIGLGKQVPFLKDDRKDRDSVAIPLKVFEDKTQYIVIQNSNDGTESQGEDMPKVETGNKDVITLTYDVREQFYYRGCGFVASYDKIKVEIEKDDNNWIKKVEVVKDKIEDEKQAHIKIYY